MRLPVSMKPSTVTAIAALCLGFILAAPEAQSAEVCTCAQDYQPVCGQDDVTYPNSCEAECASIAVLHTGPCTPAQADSAGGDVMLVDSAVLPEAGPQRHLQQLDSRNASCACPSAYAPVCTTVQTRLNACIANCYYKEAVLYEGECNPTGKPLATNATSSAVTAVVKSPAFFLMIASAALFMPL